MHLGRSLSTDLRPGVSPCLDPTWTLTWNWIPVWTLWSRLRTQIWAPEAIPTQRWDRGAENVATSFSTCAYRDLDCALDLVLYVDPDIVFDFDFDLDPETQMSWSGPACLTETPTLTLNLSLTLTSTQIGWPWSSGCWIWTPTLTFSLTSTPSRCGPGLQLGLGSGCTFRYSLWTRLRSALGSGLQPELLPGWTPIQTWIHIQPPIRTRSVTQTEIMTPTCTVTGAPMFDIFTNFLLSGILALKISIVFACNWWNYMVKLK